MLARAHRGRVWEPSQGSHYYWQVGVVALQVSVGQRVTTGTRLQAPESQKFWVRVELSMAQELAQTVVEGSGTQRPLEPQVWQVGQAETLQQNPFVQLPVVHWSPAVQLPVDCCATQVPLLQ